MPCKDEALNLPAVLPQVPSSVSEVIVVDSGSVDDTAAVARELRPDAVIVRASGPGKGNALRTGFEMATGEIIVAMDGDGSNSPREIAQMLQALEAGADVVKGSRYLPGGGSADATRVRNFGNSVLVRLFNRLHHAEHTDLCYGFIAFRAKHRDALLPTSDGFEVDALINVNASRAGLRVVEVPSREGRRIYGESNLRPVRDGWRIARTLLRERQPGSGR